MRRPRLTMRGVMIATAVLSGGMGGMVLSRRAEVYRLRAALFASHEREARSYMEEVDNLLDRLAGDPAASSTHNAACTLEGLLVAVAGQEMPIKPGDALAAIRLGRLAGPIVTLSRLGPSGWALIHLRLWSDRKSSLRPKYERAAARPWLLMDPDQPAPAPPRDIVADVAATVPAG